MKQHPIQGRIVILLVVLCNRNQIPLAIWAAFATLPSHRKLKLFDLRWFFSSCFQPVERVTRHFNPLKIPVKLQKELPFKSKPKLMKKRTKPTLETKRAVVMEPREKLVSSLLYYHCQLCTKLIQKQFI